MLENEEAQNIGELLRNARLKKGKTLGDVSKDLCIRKCYLEAIESMDADKLPEMPYGLGFVRSYADYLGLNSARITQTYKQTLYAIPEPEEQTEEISPAEYSGPDLRHVLFGVAGVFLIFAVWRGVSAYHQQKQLAEETEIAQDDVVPEPVIIEENEPVLNETENEVETEETAPVENQEEETTAKTQAEDVENTSDNNEKKIETEEKNALTETEKTKTAEKQTTVSATPTKVRISFAGPSWLELKQGDKVLLSGIYGKGFKYDVPNEAGIIVSVGRYYNVDFYIDGKLTKVASALKQTNISLDEYILSKQAQE